MRCSLGSQTFKLFTLTEPLSMENAMQNLRKLRPRYNSCYWQSSLFPHHLFLCPCTPPPTPLPRPFPKVGLLKPNVALMSSFLYMFVALKKKREREYHRLGRGLVTKATELVAGAFPVSTGHSAQFARSFVEGCFYDVWPFQSFNCPEHSNRLITPWVISYWSPKTEDLKRHIWARPSSVLRSGVYKLGLRDNMLSVSLCLCQHQTAGLPGALHGWNLPLGWQLLLQLGPPSFTFLLYSFQAIVCSPGLWGHILFIFVILSST